MTKRFINLINAARGSFLAPKLTDDTKELSNSIKVFTTKIDGKTYRVFGVKKQEQDKIDFDVLRAEILREMGIEENKNFIQFIGDSALYSTEGSKFGRDYINQELENEKDSIILYGFTGAKGKEPALFQREINQLVSDCIDQSSDLAFRSIANVVDEHSITAVEEWGCSISENVNNYFLVYTDGLKSSARFGDDVPSSDGLTNRKAIALEGGIQTLRQIIYMISRGVLVEGVMELRDLSDKTNARYYDQSTQPPLPFLSAVAFMKYMKGEIKNCKEDISEKILEKMKDEYIKDQYALYNKLKLDASTKQKLWEDAWEHFVKLVMIDPKKLDLFSYEKRSDAELKLKKSTSGEEHLKDLSFVTSLPKGKAIIDKEDSQEVFGLKNK